MSLYHKLLDLGKGVLRKDSFIQNVVIVSSGKLAVMLVSFLFVPILSRIYTPIAYGNFALYNSICTISVIVGLLGYPNAYVLIKNRVQFNGLILFQFITILLISIFSVITIILFSQYSSMISNLKLLFFVPAGILINGLIMIFSNWMVRNKDFRVSAMMESTGEIFIRIVNLLIGVFLSAYQYGLVIGNMAGRAVMAAINAFRYFKKERSILSNVNVQVVKQVLREWKHYPHYFLPNQVIQQFGSQIPVYFLALSFSNEELGYFSMSLTLFAIPVQLYSNALAPTYLHKANELYKENLSMLRKFTADLLTYGQILIFVPVILLIGFADKIIPLFLGEKWEPTALIVSIMALYLFLEILISPISSIFQVLHKEKQMTLINLFSFAVLSVGLAIFGNIGFSFYMTIVLLTAIRAITQLVRGFLICRYLNLSFMRIIGFSYSSLLAISIFLLNN